MTVTGEAQRGDRFPTAQFDILVDQPVLLSAKTDHVVGRHVVVDLRQATADAPAAIDDRPSAAP